MMANERDSELAEIVQPSFCERCDRVDVIYFIFAGIWVCEKCKDDILNDKGA